MAKSFTNEQNLQKFKELKMTGDSKIKEEIIIGNMPFVESVADSMASYYQVDNEELRQYAYEALIKAVDRYDVNLEKPFDSFLYPCIIHYFHTIFNEIYGVSRGAFSYHYVLVKRNIENDYQISLIDHPELFEEVIGILIKRNDISHKHRNENLVQVQLLNPKTIDYFDIEGNCILSNIDFLSLIEYSYLENMTDLKEVLDSNFKRLTDKEQQVLILRFGLEDGKYRILEEVGQILRLSGERIRIIEKKALRKLRTLSRRTNLREFYDDKYLVQLSEDYLDSAHMELSSTCYDEDYYMFNDIESLEENIEEVRPNSKKYIKMEFSKYLKGW